jgi:hypothetical protein
MKKKTAIIKVELVAESLTEPDEKIVKELFDWFREEAIYVPWVKDIKNITVKGN